MEAHSALLPFWNWYSIHPFFFLIFSKGLTDTHLSQAHSLTHSFIAQ